MSFGMVAASYFTAIPTLPVPLLSFGFDEGSGNTFTSAHGLVVGSGIDLQWATGPSGHGNALSRSVQDSYDQTGSIEDTPVANVETWTALSVTFWYQAMSGGDEWPFIFYLENMQDWMGVQRSSTGNMMCWIGSDLTDFTVEDVLPVGVWRHVAIVWTGPTLTAYVDGSAVVSRSTAAAASVLDHLTINGASWSHRGGTIDDFRLYDIALTPEQIDEIKDIPV